MKGKVSRTRGLCRPVIGARVAHMVHLEEGARSVFAFEKVVLVAQ